jgi:sulfate/thiosulfate transport system substrate-binding protein
VWPWLPVGRAEARPTTIVFYGFSILGDAMNRGIFPEFRRQWRARGHGDVEFVSSFAGSGTVTNQLIMGVPAQLALLALESDAQRLADAGVVAPDSWRRLPHGGVVNRTPFVILVRPGNPLGIRGFDDLTRAGVRIVHPDPLTSGGANWAIVAEYGAGAREHPDRAAAAGQAMLAGIWNNVVAQAASARAARTQFENGFGDALITYEQEAAYDRARGRLAADVVTPRRTVLSEHTLVVIDRNVGPKERPIVDAFVRFLWSEEAQKTFVKYGFRSVDDSLNDNPGFGRIEDPFTIADFGGWRRARLEIVDRVWKQRVVGAREARR